MSYWTYINGVVKVSVPGRTQPEIEYILKTVLDHLPIVSGSERDMEVYINKLEGYTTSSSRDEFGEKTNNLMDSFGQRSYIRGWLQTQPNYLLTLNASLRDRWFEETFKEFMKWMCRLSKRIHVDEVLVNIKGYGINKVIEDSEPFKEMYEPPSWSVKNGDGEPSWTEYLMWDRAKGSDYPMVLAYKYFNDEENDKEVQRRIRYFRGE